MAAAKALTSAVTKRDGLKVKIQWIEKSIIGTANPLSEIQIIEYIILIEQHLVKLDELFEVINANADPADVDTHNTEYNDMMNKTMQIKWELLDAKAKLQSVAAFSSTSTAKSVSEIRLPQINLPTFDGNLSEWMSFRDIFKSTIHDNTSISKAQKLTYLKSKLTGEAAQQVRSLSLTDCNYDIAWSQLHDRYQNERELLFSILRRFVSQPNVNPNSASSLRSLIDVSKECLRSLEVLKRPIKQWDDIILFHMFQKLDSQSKELWEQSLKDSSIPPLKDLFEFLESRSRGLAASGLNANKNSHNQLKDNGQFRRVNHVHHTQTDQNLCAVCSGNHPLYRCSKFLEMKVPEREDVVKKARLCFSCLREGHPSSKCPSTGTCRICSNKHNSLLHKIRESVPQSNNGQDRPDPRTVLSGHSVDANSIQQTLLATAIISIRDNLGQPKLCRAMLDNGSTASFVTEGCVRRLGLNYSRCRAEVVGLSSASVGTTKGIIDFSFTPWFNNDMFTMKALVLPKLTGRLPSYPCDPTIWPHLHGLELADPSFHIPSDIDILIGADMFWILLLEGKRQASINAPVAFRSLLGWLIAGGTDSGTRPNIQVHHADVDLDNRLRQFWEIESTPSTPILTKEEKQCEMHFASTHQRDANGRFTVSLPFKCPLPVLGSSRDMAVRRLLQIERRLQMNPSKKVDYTKFMNEYLNLGHMEEVPITEILKPINPINYIPHHYVLKEDSTTTKFRVVFDASMKTSSGISLNDALMVGPVIQDNMTDILTRFRKHKIAFTADIARMYRQIRMAPVDSDLQRIVWRNSPSETIRDYRLTTVTYGTAPAPYLATKALQQLAKDEQSVFPFASQIALEDFYVDDVMSGASSVDKAIDIQSELLKLMDKGGFDLRKWSSNSTALLQAIPAEKREGNIVLKLDADRSVKALGISWNTTKDVFYFKLSQEYKCNSGKLTKRKILSEVAKLFDPLGWVAPIVIPAKILIQELWKIKCLWDEEVPVIIQQQWYQMKADLKLIEQIQIPRCIVPASAVSYHLIGFSDASEKAYSAVVYLTTKTDSGEVHTSLLSSKTRVAPIKQLSLPRLELCGALLVATLMSNLKTCLKLHLNEIKAFSDSEIVLAWLRSPPTRWKTFVANKVSEIQDVLPDCVWSHVPGVDNPADCASRGITAQECIDHPLWWNGPSWLRSGNYPQTNVDSIQDTDLESKETKIQCNLVTMEFNLIQRYSKLSKLLRVTSWIYRFIHNIRVRIDIRHKRFPLNRMLTSSLCPKELEKALDLWISTVQQQSFSKEILQLRNQCPLKPKSSILMLSPFLDEHGLLRVGGRLKNAPIPASQKYPILLPRHNRLTELIIMNEHITYFHAGAQLVMSMLNKRFWILRFRDAVRHQIRKCVTCTRHSAVTQQQIMGNLPASRVTPARAFQQCGVDYAGPFQLRPISPRSKASYKAYLALFICFTTRAIHLEVVSSLDTPSFLAALRRFIARRGMPAVIHSDCGTNFVGAEREMKDMINLVNNSNHNTKIADQLSSQGIMWKFNPAGSPHFGGLWEAGVKSVKYHLKRVIGTTRLTFEEMSTLVTQIEACLNSRPLTPLSADPNDFEVLTPGHFLIGAPMISVPEPDLTILKEGRLSRWQRMQQMNQLFWHRWSQEFISRLQQRPKWLKQSDEIKINSMVLIKEDRLPPLQWKLGRVTTLHPGNDGIVRVVTIKTATGEIQRSITKICLLPIDNSNDVENNSI